MLNALQSITSATVNRTLSVLDAAVKPRSFAGANENAVERSVRDQVTLSANASAWLKAAKTETTPFSVLRQAEAEPTITIEKRDFSGANFRGVLAAGTDFSNADLSEANFQQSDLRGANLRNANLSYANLQAADLTGADLTGAVLVGADLRYARGLTSDMLASASTDQYTILSP